MEGLAKDIWDLAVGMNKLQLDMVEMEKSRQDDIQENTDSMEEKLSQLEELDDNARRSVEAERWAKSRS